MVIVDEDWIAGRRHLRKEGIEKVSKRFPERKNKEYILEEVVINLEAQKAIITT